MRSSLPLGAYQPGRSLLHRWPAGPKLIGLFVIGVTVVSLRGWWPPLVALGIAVIVAASARLPWRTVWSGLRPLLLLIAVLGAFQLWQQGWPTAVETVATLVTLIIGSIVLTATTPVDLLLDAIVKGISPIRPLGVNPEKVALAFSLMIRAIPEIFVLFTQTREAAKARGLERSPRAVLVPLAIRTVAHAHATGEALHARGLGDD